MLGYRGRKEETRHTVRDGWWGQVVFGGLLRDTQVVHRRYWLLRLWREPLFSGQAQGTDQGTVVIKHYCVYPTKLGQIECATELVLTKLGDLQQIWPLCLMPGCLGEGVPGCSCWAGGCHQVNSSGQNCKLLHPQYILDSRLSHQAI